MTLDWMILIYTLPSQPSRKRAYVWRELKKVGAVYLRDGVALLPRRPDLERRLSDIADRIEEYEGMVELIVGPKLLRHQAPELIERFQGERAAEYRELYHACVRFLRDVLDEVAGQEFGFPDVDNLESELTRLRRWREQIEERDYFGAPGADRVREILEKCDRAFERFVSTASEHEGSQRGDEDDVFERLGGPGAAQQPVPDDFPL